MAAQQGFEYEKNAAKVLKEYKLVPENFTPAGAGHNQPDLMLMHKKIRAGCELKIMAASAGSLVLKYNGGNKSNPWGFGNVNQADEEKWFIKKLAEQVKLFDQIKKQWPNVPYKREPRDLQWQKTAGKMDERERYERDKKMFPDIRGEIDARAIEKYYNNKNTYYVNVGTHGFYLLGNKNPLNLKGVPHFSKSASAIYRARVQYKGSGNYQFTFEMQFSMIAASPFNIAPINTKTKTVNIDMSRLNLQVFGIEV